MAAVLEVRDLRTELRLRHRVLPVVNGVSFSLDAGETLGIVGESGCGKSMAALSIMRLVPTPPGRIAGGSVLLDGVDLLALSERRMRRLRGSSLSMVFQEPMTALNPLRTIGSQMIETITLHQGGGARAARDRAEEMLRLVRIPDARTRLDDYPHHLSGGMRQRVMIAMALACGPRVLLADEPTTALDVTIQAQIMAVLAELRDRLGMATVLITPRSGPGRRNHRPRAGDVWRPFGGNGVHRGSVRNADASLHARIAGFGAAHRNRRGRGPAGRHQAAAARDQGYGAAFGRVAARLPLCAALPAGVRAMRRRDAALRGEGGRPSGGMLAFRPRGGAGRMSETSTLVVQDLAKHYQRRGGWLGRDVTAIRAVDGVSFTVHRGETLGWWGESGCGKSTVGKTVLRLLEPTGGRITLLGTDITDLKQPALRPLRRQMQMIFQDPYSSLNPRQTAGQIVAEPIATHGLASGAEKWDRVAALMQRVGLQPGQIDALPHQFSGGQRQRIAIARALAAEPQLIVGDEPVSALDVSIQAQVVNLLMDLQDEYGLAYLFIAHDLAVVQHISHRVAVMYLGRIVELAATAEIFARPLHPYTRALLDSVPVPDPARRHIGRTVLQGDMPSPMAPPPGCPFHTRCPQAMARCRSEPPALLEDAPGHWSACHLGR